MNDANWMVAMYMGPTIKYPKARRNRNNRTKANDVLAALGPCPRSVDQVFALGVRIQYYVGEIYLELESSNQGTIKNQFKNLALRQLVAKDKVEKLAHLNLNKLLTNFYYNGGLIIEPPVSEQMAQELQPFFMRISANFLKQLGVIVNMASKDNFCVSELECSINDNITEMYNSMSRLFPVEEIKAAFYDLIRVRENINMTEK